MLECFTETQWFGPKCCCKLLPAPQGILGLASKELLPGMTTWNMGKPDYASALKQSQHLPPLKCCWVRGCAVFIFWDKCLMAWASFQQGIKAKFGMFNRIQQFCFQADLAAALTWSLGTQVPRPGGMNSYPDNFCRESSGEKASGWH